MQLIKTVRITRQYDMTKLIIILADYQPQRTAANNQVGATL
jgi:hypothetical protein